MNKRIIVEYASWNLEAMECQGAIDAMNDPRNNNSKPKNEGRIIVR